MLIEKEKGETFIFCHFDLPSQNSIFSTERSISLWEGRKREEETLDSPTTHALIRVLCVYVCVCLYFWDFFNKKENSLLAVDGLLVIGRGGEEAPLRFFSITFLQCVFCSLVLDFFRACLLWLVPLIPLDSLNICLSWPYSSHQLFNIHAFSWTSVFFVVGAICEAWFLLAARDGA